MRSSLIEKFAPILCDPRPPVVRDPRLLMDASGDVKIYYAPFEYINPSARIVQKVLDRLIQERVLKPDRVIGGMLHPSGNCTYRINYLIGDRSAPIPHATNPMPYDQGRRAFRERFVTA